MASAKVSEVINLIKTAQSVVEIFVPSLERKVKFKLLTAGQQEKFVQAIVDNPAIQSKFVLALVDIIKENCEEKHLVNGFTIVDRYAIGLGLRAASVGNIVRTEVENEPGTVYNIDLKDTLTSIEKGAAKIIPFEPITVGNIKLELQYPTISLETSNERYFKREDVNFEGTAEAIRSMVSTAFIGDALMFIKTLTITKDEGEPVVLDFNGVTIQDKLEIVRKLPTTVYEKMLTPMSIVKGQIESLLKAVGTSETDKKVKRTILIAFDPSLFIASS